MPVWFHIGVFYACILYLRIRSSPEEIKIVENCKNLTPFIQLATQSTRS